MSHRTKSTVMRAQEQRQGCSHCKILIGRGESASAISGPNEGSLGFVVGGVGGREWDSVSLAFAAKNPAAPSPPSHPAHRLFFLFLCRNCNEAKQNTHCHSDNSTTSYFSVT